VRILIGELQDAPRVLAEWDVIQPEDGGYRMRVEMLRQWIAERKPLSRVRDEMDRVLPAAENLFQAAYSIYQGGQLDDAEPLLRQSVNLNPNHLKANQLLAEILLAKGDTDEALKIFEFLYEYNPCDVKHRLVQVFLVKSKTEKDENRQLAIYEKILKIEPNQPDVLIGYKKAYERQGDRFYKNNELNTALELYKKASSTEKIEKVNKEIKLDNLYQQSLNAFTRNEKEKAQRLLIEILSIDPSFKETTRVLHLSVTGVDINKKMIEIHIENLYQRSLNAFERNEKEESQKLLTEILSIDPSFKETLRYLYLSVIGVDIKDMINESKSIHKVIADDYALSTIIKGKDNKNNKDIALNTKNSDVIEKKEEETYLFTENNETIEEFFDDSSVTEIIDIENEEIYEFINSEDIEEIFDDSSIIEIIDIENKKICEHINSEGIESDSSIKEREEISEIQDIFKKILSNILEIINIVDLKSEPSSHCRFTAWEYRHGF